MQVSIDTVQHHHAPDQLRFRARTVMCMCHAEAAAALSAVPAVQKGKMQHIRHKVPEQASMRLQGVRGLKTRACTRKARESDRS